MKTETRFALMRRAVTLFPRTAYSEDSAVRHIRRGWILSREVLGNKWILHKQVQRVIS